MVGLEPADDRLLAVGDRGLHGSVSEGGRIAGQYHRQRRLQPRPGQWSGELAAREDGAERQHDGNLPRVEPRGGNGAQDVKGQVEHDSRGHRRDDQVGGEKAPEREEETS